MSTLAIPGYEHISIPRQLRVTCVNDFEGLMAELGRKSLVGYVGSSFFGTAFVQGTRLQFTTAMPIEKMLELTSEDRSQKRDNIESVSDHSNRPEEVPHAKAIRVYLENTACLGEKFILPAFTFNYGVALDDDDPTATLVVFTTGDHGANGWPAIFMLPRDASLDTTDGAHRRKSAKQVLDSSKVSIEHKDQLRKNAVDVKIVFETDRADSHQDFADCGKAKAIPKSTVTSFDVRDKRNRRSVDLVKAVPFLKHYVDATASNVNLTGKSKMVWSMTAVRTFVGHVEKKHPQERAELEEKTDGAEEFFAALVTYLPQLQALEEVRHNPNPATTTAVLRAVRGGDIALRGIGMAIFARAFLHCHVYDLPLQEMAKKLGSLDWHVLTVARDTLPADDVAFGNAVRANSNEIWSQLLIIGEGRYRISSSSSDADTAWTKICAKLFPGQVFPVKQPVQQAAE